MKRLVVLLVLLMAGLSAPAAAHDARPLAISIAEQAAGLYRVDINVPPSVEAINQPSLTWPKGCQLQGDVVSNGRGLSRELVRCEGTLDGRTVGIRYAAYNPSLSTVVRLTPLDGSPRVSVLPPAQPEWTAPRAPDRWSLALEYLQMGMKHIFGGFDHLLFVTGLLLLARTTRRVLLVITGFTIAHSITLSLSALNIVYVPSVPTEAAIALSILFLASEIARDQRDSLAFRYPLIVSSTFGLLHGLGFAAALKEIGLPQGEIPVALLCFNLGVEAGQIAFVLPVAGLFWLMKRLRVHHLLPSLTVTRRVAAYGLGIPAAFWFVERVARF